MQKHILLALFLLFVVCGLMYGVESYVVFREIASPGNSTITRDLILMEDANYPTGSGLTDKSLRWLIQLYKDGGDGVISPLDSLGNPTGDDTLVNDDYHLQTSQGIYFPVTYVWMTSTLKFSLQDQGRAVSQGDNIYLRIFNKPSLDNANKYIVSHSLYAIPEGKSTVQYVPDYGWDKAGWITFRTK